MDNISRRSFLGTLPALAMIDWRDIALRLGKSDSPSATASWSLKDHVADWVKNYKFPFDRRLFLFPERVSIRQYDFSNRRPRGNKATRPMSVVHIQLWTKTRLDLKIQIGAALDRLPTNAQESTRLGAEGEVDFAFPLDFLPGERVFYQVLCREGSESYKPISPPRCFFNPAYRENAVLYALGDHHCFDDHYDAAAPLSPGGSSISNGLDGAYFYDFLTKFIQNPGWRVGADAATAQNIALLGNTCQLAEALAWMISADTLPDLIVKGGDDVGIHEYRFERQGLPQFEYESNSWKLWLKERIIWGVLSPLVPILHIEGNHDGGGIWHNPAHPYAKAARKAYWHQPGAESGSSPDENYGVMELAKGRLQLFFIDVVEQSGADGVSPRRPEHYKLGLVQTRWLADRLSRSQAETKLIAQHHVLGGWPLTPDGSGPGGYGRGPLMTYEDHAKYQDAISPALNLNDIQQCELTNLCRDNNVLAVLGNHDHVWFSKFVGKTKLGRNLHFIVPGTTNTIGEERVWWRSSAWLNDYGAPAGLNFYSAPVISRIDARKGQLSIKAICAGHYDDRSNLVYLPSRPTPGDILKEVII